MLSEEQVAFYQENGYLHLKGVVTGAELAALQGATARLIDFARQYDRVPQPEYLYKKNPQTGKPVLWRINNLTKRDEVFRAHYGHPKLLEVVASLVGYNAIIGDESVVIKMPEYGAPVSWHRDIPTDLPKASDAIAVIGLDLDAATVENGCVYVLPGSHKWPDADIQEMVMQHGFHLPGAVPVESEPGDMVIHSANTLHGSRSSRAGQLRRTIYYGVHRIDQYINEYQATPAHVKIQTQFIQRGIQLRRKQPYAQGERPFDWQFPPEWHTDLKETDHVEWGTNCAHPR